MKLVLWSGGLDSTAILLYYLKEKEPFETAYITLENNKAKAKQEKKARKKILKALEHHYGVKITDREIKISSVSFRHDPVMAQPLVWMFGLLQLIHSKVDGVAMGYVKEDCFWHIKHNFTRAWWHLRVIMDNNFDCLPNIVYPFEWYTKKDLIDQFYSNDIGKYVFDMIWVCEDVTDDKKQCGKCEPCKRFKKVKKYFGRKKK